MYIPRNWEFGSALVKLRNFGGGVSVRPWPICQGAVQYCDLTVSSCANLPVFRLICFPLQTAEKGLDFGELWRSRQSTSSSKKNDVDPAPAAPSAPAGSSFKRWRRSAGTRNAGGRTSPGHGENCSSKEPPGVGDRSLLKFLALVSGRISRLEVMYTGTLWVM
jgi:hypothetical protein